MISKVVAPLSRMLYQTYRPWTARGHTLDNGYAKHKGKAVLGNCGILAPRVGEFALYGYVALA